MELDTTKAQTIYYIPYSKKAVDDIIAKCANTDKDKGITFTINSVQKIIHLDNINKCHQEINSVMSNLVHGHGKKSVNTNTNQQFNNMRNGLQKRNQRMVYPLNLLKLFP